MLMSRSCPYYRLDDTKRKEENNLVVPLTQCHTDDILLYVMTTTPKRKDKTMTLLLALAGITIAVCGIAFFTYCVLGK